MRHAHNFKDITGQRFGRLEVIEYSHTKNKTAYWKCRCICGVYTTVSTSSLKTGNTKSCGCQKIDALAYKNKYNNPMFNEESKEKMRESLRGLMVGDKNPRWNANLTEADRIFGRKIYGYNEWRMAVYKRDNFTCQCCGDNRGGNLVAHHKEAYNNNPDLRTEVENGITLCEECHNNFHHIFGFGNNTKKQIYYFMLENGGISCR